MNVSAAMIMLRNGAPAIEPERSSTTDTLSGASAAVDGRPRTLIAAYSSPVDVRGPMPQLMSTGAVAGLSATGCGHSGAGAIANTISSLRFCKRGVTGKLTNTMQLLDDAARTSAAMNAARRAAV